MVTIDGYIKLYRSLIDWEWYSDINTRSVFIHLLLTANFEDKNWRGITIKRGQVVTSYRKLAEEIGISERSVRTSINRLKSTHEVTQSSTSKFTVLTVNNYDKYQSSDTVSDTQVTSKRHTSDTQVTTTKEIKKVRSKESKNKPPISPTGDGLQERFEMFWEVYPKKVAKQAAVKAWQKLKPGDELTAIIVESVKQQTHSEQWSKDNGRFIPYPATWLNGERWKDEAEQTEVKTDSNTSYDINKIKQGFNDFDNLGW